jgi:hypothetical protein
MSHYASPNKPSKTEGGKKWVLLLSSSRNLNKSFSFIIETRAALAKAAELEFGGVHISDLNLLFPWGLHSISAVASWNFLWK